MDGVSAPKNLSKYFFEEANRILSQTSLAEDFFWQLLELLEDEIGIHTPGLCLPGLEGRKVFAMNRGLHTFLDTIRTARTEAPPHPEFALHTLEELGPKAWFACDNMSSQHPVLAPLLDLLPFYFRVADRMDRLSRNTRISHCLLSLYRRLQEDASPNDLLETMESSSMSGQVFFVSLPDETMSASEATLNLLKKHESAFLSALRDATGLRSLFIREEFHADIRSLMLYPVFLEEDLNGFLGCFSTSRHQMHELDLTLLCDVVMDPHLIRALRPSMKP